METQLRHLDKYSSRNKTQGSSTRVQLTFCGSLRCWWKQPSSFLGRRQTSWLPLHLPLKIYDFICSFGNPNGMSNIEFLYFEIFCLFSKGGGQNEERAMKTNSRESTDPGCVKIMNYGLSDVRVYNQQSLGPIS